MGYANDYGRLPKSVYIGFDFNTIDGLALDAKYLVSGININTKIIIWHLGWHNNSRLNGQ